MKAPLLLLGGLLAGACFGCSGGDEWTKNLPETVAATGVVLLDGKPVEGASVVFAPADGAKYPAKALTDSSGHFSLDAFPSKEGAVPGKYKIQISKTVEIAAEAPVAAVAGPDAAHTAESEDGETRYVNALPKQYANPNTSGLTAEIPPDGTTNLKFELKK